MNDDLKRKIFVQALLNAREYNGVTNMKSVMGRMMGKYPEHRKDAKLIKEIAEDLISKNFPMPMDKIDDLLMELDPNAIKAREAQKQKQVKATEERKGQLTPLPNAVEGQVKVRYAPDPSKYPHMGHALNYRVNRMYADLYKGSAVLRFDDTNPVKVKPEYYDAIKDGLRWAKATWDEEVRASNFLEEFYQAAREFIHNKDFFVCTCEHTEMKRLRESGIACPCRANSIKRNLELFEQMVAGDMEANTAIVRLVGDLQSNNQVMRDPVMFRIIHAKHPMLDAEHYLWPMYDFESSYLDHKLGITHIIRSGEFGAMREELQSYIINKLGGPVPTFFSFGRYNIKGCPTKGRVLRELVENGTVTGWDDIRLVTIAGLQKRGIQPEVITDLIRENGTTPSTSTIDWSVVEKYNKKIIEPQANRYFFVQDPVKLEIKGLAEQTVTMALNPHDATKGERQQTVNNYVWIAAKDLASRQEGEEIRLKDLCNIKLTSKQSAYVCDENLHSSIPKIQWVGEKYLEGNLLVPDLLEKEKGVINVNSLQTITGYFEKDTANIVQNEIVQLERVGFAKLSKVNDQITGHIIHK